MFEAFLVTTSSEGLRALGMREQRAYELVADAVRERLGERHAALFGEPVTTAHGDQYDWYAPVAGKASKLTALDEQRQTLARAALAELSAAISTEAARLRASGNLDDLRLGEALENALQVPGDECIYVVETVRDGASALQPVLVNWAWISDRQRAVRGVLTGADIRKPAPAAPAPPIAATETPASATGLAPPGPSYAGAPLAARSWVGVLFGLGWLALAAMIAAIILLLVAPCGLGGLPGLSFCPKPGPVVSAAEARTLVLEDQITAIERELAAMDRACQPAPPLRAAPPVSPIPPRPSIRGTADSDVETRIAAGGAQQGELSFTLAWDSVADLHLEVTCPSGQTLSFEERARCGGSLDVAGNHSRSTARTDPIENVFFRTTAPGIYSVRVTLYDAQDAANSQPFRLLIRDRTTTKVLTGVVTSGDAGWTTTYQPVGL